MILSLNHQLFWILLLIFVCFTELVHQANIVKIGHGSIYLQFRCYRNVDHLKSNGRRCDPLQGKCDTYFTICISQAYIPTRFTKQNCPLHYEESKVYFDHDFTCTSSTENSDKLPSIIINNLSFPLKFYVNIRVMDKDNFNNEEHIAQFFTEFEQFPSQNFSYPRFKQIYMSRVDFRYSNPNVKLKVGLALQCTKNRFGNNCERFCEPTNRFFCSKSGNIICRKGWKGEKCISKDVCYHHLCRKGASCKEIDNIANCVCNNGQIGPNCNANQNPCSKNPCKNDGKCQSSKFTEIQCLCKRSFYGTFCESKAQLCFLEPCQNNGTCLELVDNTRICNCSQGFHGRLCHLIINNKNIKAKSLLKMGTTNIIIIISNLFLSIIILIFCMIMAFCKFKEQKKKQLRKKLPNLPLSSNDFPKQFINSISSPIMPNNPIIQYHKENIYDSPKYYCLNEVANTKEEVFTFNNISHPDSSELQFKYEPKYMKPITIRESVELFPLPTIALKKKLSLKTFFSKS